MSTVSEKETRRIQRFSLALPVRVEGRTNQINIWEEITRLTDISVFGAGFNLKHNVKCGSLLQMTMPLPRQMRCYDYTEPQYKVWGIVRSCISKEASPDSETPYSVGIAFIGKNPPSGYFENPDKTFEISLQEEGKLWKVVEVEPEIDASDAILSIDSRRHSRLAIPNDIVVEKLDAEGNVIASEATVTENVSLSGAAIFSTLPVETGEFVRVKSSQYDVSIISVVRGKRTGQDNIPRLHVEFVDRFFPLEGIE